MPFTVQYNNVGNCAVDPYNIGIVRYAYSYKGSGLGLETTKYTGLTYTYECTLSKNIVLKMVYLDRKADGTLAHNQEFQVRYK